MIDWEVTAMIIAKLTYDAAAERLFGAIGNAHIYQTAYSGGGRGHRAHITRDQTTRYLHNNPQTQLYGQFATTKAIEDKAHHGYVQRGGPIPPGHYLCRYVANH